METKAKFRDVPMRAVMRHLLCNKEGCGGELRSAGQGMTTFSTKWLHRCDKCGAESWTQHTYPSIIHVPQRSSDESVSQAAQ